MYFRTQFPCKPQIERMMGNTFIDIIEQLCLQVVDCATYENFYFVFTWPSFWLPLLPYSHVRAGFWKLSK